MEEDKRGLVTIRRTAESSNINSKRFLNSCEGWAGDGCQLTAAQKEEFARRAAIAKNKTACLSKNTEFFLRNSRVLCRLVFKKNRADSVHLDCPEKTACLSEKNQSKISENPGFF